MYIGAVPSFVLIALAEPVKGLYFLVFILVLQQLDGNFIGPKILGDSTGLSGNDIGHAYNYSYQHTIGHL